MDFYASSDFEDIIAVMDSRTEIVSEIKICNKELSDFLISSFIEILNSKSYQGAISGHFTNYGRLANDRIELLEQKIIAIINR